MSYLRIAAMTCLCVFSFILPTLKDLSMSLTLSDVGAVDKADVRCHQETCSSEEFCDDFERRCSRCTDGVCKKNDIPEPCKHRCAALAEADLTKPSHVRHKDIKIHKCCVYCCHQSCDGKRVPRTCWHFCPNVHPVSQPVSQLVRCKYVNCRSGEFCDDVVGRCSWCVDAVCRRPDIPVPCEPFCPPVTKDSPTTVDHRDSRTFNVHKENKGRQCCKECCRERCAGEDATHSCGDFCRGEYKSGDSQEAEDGLGNIKKDKKSVGHKGTSSDLILICFLVMSLVENIIFTRHYF